MLNLQPISYFWYPLRGSEKMCIALIPPPPSNIINPVGSCAPSIDLLVKYFMRYWPCIQAYFISLRARHLYSYINESWSSRCVDFCAPPFGACFCCRTEKIHVLALHIPRVFVYALHSDIWLYSVASSSWTNGQKREFLWGISTAEAQPWRAW